MQKILCRLPNWVGDVIMCLPSLALLEQHQIEPILLGKPWIHQLLAGFGLETHTWPQAKWQAIKLLRQFDTQEILLFPNSFSSACIARLSGKTSMGYQGDGRNLLLSQAFKRPALEHETDIFYHLASKLVAEHNPPKLIPKLILGASCQTEAKELLSRHQIPKNFILICPFAHGLNRQGQAKTWPKWDELYQALEAYHPVICPGPNELKAAQDRFPNAHIMPNLTLDQYAAIASLAQIVIANDSGPMHLAAAINAPTIGIFGATDPKRSGPRNASILGKLGQWPNLDEVLQAVLARMQK